MQNRYVCDVADFGKFGLLRYLIRPDPKVDKTDFRVGVVWYFHPDERHGSDKNKINKDGRHTNYLGESEGKRQVYGACDLSLWGALGRLFGDKKRCVHCLEKAEVLPKETAFFNAMLHFPAYMTLSMRRAARAAWLSAALAKTEGADIVLLDPDTGLAPPEKKYLREGPKYAYLSDLEEFWNSGKSIILYQHTWQGKKTKEFAQEQARSIQESWT